MTALPAEGRMAWVRAWYGVPAKRGAAVTVDGERGLVLSAKGGFVAVRLWTTGKRVQVRPTALRFA
ncbi:hypothetical protein [Jatrophihabitans sp.]|uniref:hypothetical protein n=1 Tax=Jatrophihabitans sp. TaxID=1932789 RepID=UPI0030C754E0|nr:hypothetical protein [Jatrophihabitans sp.]